MKSKHLYKIGFAQTKPILGKIEINSNSIIDTMKSHKYDLLVFPELATCGYDFKTKSDIKRSSISIDSIFFKTVKEICIKNKSGIVIGFAEKSASKIYNSSILINEKGKMYLYRKSHLFYNEKKIFEKGDTGFIIGKLNRLKIGQMICFDWFFPEAARTIALKGAHIIAHPANLVMPYCQESMKTRTLENSIYAITSNRIGSEGDYTFTGKSQITDYRGNIMKSGYGKRECTMFVDIDIKNAENKFLNPKNNIIHDRRTELYEL